MIFFSTGSNKTEGLVAQEGPGLQWLFRDYFVLEDEDGKVFSGQPLSWGDGEHSSI